MQKLIVNINKSFQFGSYLSPPPSSWSAATLAVSLFRSDKRLPVCSSVFSSAGVRYLLGDAGLSPTCCCHSCVSLEEVFLWRGGAPLKISAETLQTLERQSSRTAFLFGSYFISSLISDSRIFLSRPLNSLLPVACTDLWCTCISCSGRLISSCFLNLLFLNSQRSLSG